MEHLDKLSYTAFDGHKLLIQGPLDKVVLKVKKHLGDNPTSPILVFSDSTGKQIDFDLSGSDKDVLQRLQVYIAVDQPLAHSGLGRPKLGVVSREVSLLPEHWEWLATQSGGASATLRKLVDQAKKQLIGKDSVKRSQERTYAFMSALAGNLPNYEEALRALFAKNKKKFEAEINEWPKDVKNHATKMAKSAF